MEQELEQVPQQVQVSPQQRIMAQFNNVDMDDVNLMVGAPNTLVFQWKRAYNQLSAEYDQLSQENAILRAQLASLQEVMANGSGKSASPVETPDATEAGEALKGRDVVPPPVEELQAVAVAGGKKR